MNFPSIEIIWLVTLIKRDYIFRNPNFPKRLLGGRLGGSLGLGLADGLGLKLLFLEGGGGSKKFGHHILKDDSIVTLWLMLYSLLLLDILNPVSWKPACPCRTIFQGFRLYPSESKLGSNIMTRKTFKKDFWLHFDSLPPCIMMPKQNRSTGGFYWSHLT
jgi:hypothetical protein